MGRPISSIASMPVEDAYGSMRERLRGPQACDETLLGKIQNL
jgi:hypothetical protein